MRPLSETATVNAYRRATWIILGLWLIFCLATTGYNGPFLDEAIHATAGQRTLEGHGHTDNYLRWFYGSLFWPVLSALGYRVAGLRGSRSVAVILAAVAFLATLRTAKNLFGQRARFWTAVTFAVSGPFLALARLGVYDILALTGIAVSLWAATELARSDNRAWLVLSTTAFTMAMLAKYPAGLMLLPICAVMIALRREKALLDLSIFGLISSALALSYFLPLREQLASLTNWYLTNTPTFGDTRLMTGFRILYLSGAPLLLALIGWSLARPRRGPAGVLLIGLAVWPAYHLAAGHPVSMSEHLVYGYLFGYPLAGFALATLWGDAERNAIARRGGAIVITAMLAAIGLVQLNQFNHAWPDTREAADYLIEQVEPGQKLLSNEGWPYAMVLYAEGRIDSPWDVFDAYRVAQGQTEMDLCEHDWFVDSVGSFPWPESVKETIVGCVNFMPAFYASSTVIGLNSDMLFVSYSAPIVVWRNLAKR